MLVHPNSAVLTSKLLRWESPCGRRYRGSRLGLFLHHDQPRRRASGDSGTERCEERVFSVRHGVGMIWTQRCYTSQSLTLRPDISETLAPVSARVTNIAAAIGSSRKFARALWSCSSLIGSRSSLLDPAPLMRRLAKTLGICRLCYVMAKFTAALSTDNIRTALLGDTRASKWSRSALASARVISDRDTYCSFCLPKTATISLHRRVTLCVISLWALGLSDLN